MGTQVRPAGQHEPLGSSSWPATRRRQGQEPQAPLGEPENKPQIYVHFEFGLSWTPSSQPKNHSYTYMSRSLRDQQPGQSASRSSHPSHHPMQPSHFTRLVPPPTTNYLVPVPRHQAEHRQQVPRPDGGGRGTGRSGRQQERTIQNHERGSSAPPPLSDSPWDSNAEPGPSSHPVQPRHQPGSRFPPQVWKELPPRPGPAVSGRFVVEAPWEGAGRDGGGFAEYHPDHDRTIAPTPAAQRRRRRSDRDRREQGEHPRFANTPTTIPIDSRHVPTRAMRRGEDPARVRELEDLGSAMMTVDNGFENQWWYQGERENVQHLAFASEGLLSAANRSSFLSDSGVGYYPSASALPTRTGAGVSDDPGGLSGEFGTWASVPTAFEEAVAGTDQGANSDRYCGYPEGFPTPSRAETCPAGDGGQAAPTPNTPFLRGPPTRNESLVVSPLTEAGTPYYSSLDRSFTTRSEELHF